MDPERQGEWSVDGTVFHICGGSDGCMCVYDPECNTNIKNTQLSYNVVVSDELVDELIGIVCAWSGETGADYMGIMVQVRQALMRASSRVEIQPRPITPDPGKPQA